MIKTFFLHFCFKLRDLTKALLKREKDATVIIVDWVGGSSPPYGRAATNIRLVGAMAAHVIHLIYVSLMVSY